MKGLMWLFVILAGMAIFALGVWLDFRDGTPTMTMGEQPFEVVVAEGLGIALLINGLYRFWRSFKRNEDRRD